MKYYIDTEFIEYPHTIDLISIGIVCEDGRELYLISDEFDATKAHPWVKENVIDKLETDVLRYSKAAIAAEIELFVHHDKPEFWGCFCDYDWVVFCWLFGSMVDLPSGYPMYCRDLKQLLDETGAAKLPDPAGEHNALVDAKWNMKLHKHILAE